MKTLQEVVGKAIDEIRCLNADERLREQIRVQTKAMFDYGSDMAAAEKRGVVKGRAEGRAEGRMEGRAEGRMETYSEVVDKMRQNGFSEEQIKLVVGDGYNG